MSREQVIAKIRQLQVKATDSASLEAESVACLQKAQKLIAEHMISEDELKSSLNESSLGVYEYEMDPYSPSRHALIHCVAEMFGCRVTNNKHRRGKMRILGRRLNAESSVDMFQKLVEKADRIANDHLGIYPQQMVRMREGLYVGLAWKIYKINKAAPQNGDLLLPVVRDIQEIDEKLAADQNVEHGVLSLKDDLDSPAARLGMQVGLDTDIHEGLKR